MVTLGCIGLIFVCISFFEHHRRKWIKKVFENTKSIHQLDKRAWFNDKNKLSLEITKRKMNALEKDFEQYASEIREAILLLKRKIVLKEG